MIDVVIGDIHARQDSFRAILEEIGIITINSGDPMRDVRNEGFRIHQLGDAVSLGYGEQEVAFYNYFWHIINKDDVVLIGNHELPVMWPNWSMDFSGWEDRDRECEQLVRDKWQENRLVAASSIGDWLLTHAGLIPRYQRHYRESGASMAEVAEDLQKLLLQSINDFDRAQLGGPITGMDSVMGGIFWVRTNGHINMEPGLHFKQIFGHTLAGPLEIRPNVWLLDTEPKPEIYDIMRRGGRPARSDFGGVAAMVFETPDAKPELHHIII